MLKAIDWTNAAYWGGTYAALPGTRLRIEGLYPYSRYIGWNVYDSAARPIDALSDFELAPDPGSSNPFLPGADRTVTERSYTAFVEVGSAPAQPAPNTLHIGDSQGGTFLYRVYVPDAGRDEKGGGALPRVTLESKDGTGTPLTVEQCRELQAPYAQPLNDLIAGSAGLPDPTADGEGFPGRNVLRSPGKPGHARRFRTWPLPERNATSWATTTRAASTSAARLSSRRRAAAAAESDLLDWRRSWRPSRSARAPARPRKLRPTPALSASSRGIRSPTRPSSASWSSARRSAA